MNNKGFSGVVALCLFGFSSVLYAQGTGLDSADLLDNLLARFYNTASTWEFYMKACAEWLFWGLAIISMAWTYGLMALRKADSQEFLAETIQFFAVLGFFYWLLDHGPALATALIDTLRQIASKASGLPNLMSPSKIVDVGFDIVSKVVDNSSIWSPASTIVGLLVAGIILVALALVGVNMLIVLISAWIISYGGIFLLGFGGGRWTQDIAINYYRTILGIGLQAFAMVLLIGIGHSFIDQYYAAMASNISLKELFVMLVVSLILLALVNKITPMLAGIAQGGGAGGGGGIGLGAAMGAASLAAAAVSGGASMVASAALSAAGGGSALSAAFKAASQTMVSGGMENAGLSSALGQAGRFASSFSSHLAGGTAEVMRNKMDAIKESFAEKIGETTGGQVAESIHQRLGDESESADLNESIGSLSAGDDSLSDEVSHFVNKTTVSGE